ncbi:MAG: hypothetical protein WDA02_09385 [Saccharofermentanales bacterium]
MDKELKNGLSGLFSLVILISAIVVLFRTCDGGLNAISEYSKQQKELIGKKVVIEKDTLIIVDYDMLKSSYILNSGLTIDQDYTLKILIKNEGLQP